MNTNSLLLLALSALLLLGLAGCDWEDSGGPEAAKYSITIDSVIVRPNPVVTGDTVVFTAVTKDSLNPDFLYVWGGISLLKRTERNRLVWRVPVPAGTYSYAVFPRHVSGEMYGDTYFTVVVLPRD